jgi:hypothetical protein
LPLIALFGKILRFYGKKGFAPTFPRLPIWTEHASKIARNTTIMTDQVAAKKVLQELAKRQDLNNKVCCDCSNPNPQWASVRYV